MPTQEMPPNGQPPQRVGVLSKLPKGKHPACPKCERRMTVKQVTPLLFASGMDDVVYGCDDCGTEIKKTVKRA